MAGRLLVACPTCHASNLPKLKYCLSCGERMDARPHEFLASAAWLVNGALPNDGICWCWHLTHRGGPSDAVGRRVSPRILGIKDDICLRSAAMTMRISHPNVLQCFEFDRDERGRAYRIDEVWGTTFEEWAVEKKDEPAEILRVGAAIARTLIAIHAVGIVHGNVTPGAIRMDDGRGPKIGVFDVAVAIRDAVATNMVVGEEAYMPREALSQQPGLGSDVFQLGAVLFEALTGASFYVRAASTPEMIAQIWNGVSEPISSRAPSLPTPLTALFDAMTATDIVHRPSAQDVERELLNCVGIIGSPEP